jgi:16S rRNA (guanine(966)-N(2))-methyltransferase RsmD
LRLNIVIKLQILKRVQETEAYEEGQDMRVIAGEQKGLGLKTPKGRTTRPTSDQVRIACLDILTPWLPGSCFLDLFAGAGAVGIEALSRGAEQAVFVESDRRAIRALRENIARLDLSTRARIVSNDALRAVRRLRHSGERFSLVFLDPPYDTPLALTGLRELADGALLSEPGFVIVQHRTKSTLPERVGLLEQWRARRFGETTLTFFRPVE